MKSEEFYNRNSEDWKTIHRDIFGSIIPKRCIWTNPEDIASVLNKIGRIPSSNHSFFPSGGGLDLEGASSSYEPNCIELDFGIAHVVKPKELIFESIDPDLEWNYFRLELLQLAASGVYGDDGDEAFDEELCELNSGNYVHRHYWDEGEYDDERLPSSARPLIRILKGSIVIFKKSSIYNGNSMTYDARHETMGAERFKEHILAAYAAVGS